MIKRNLIASLGLSSLTIASLAAAVPADAASVVLWPVDPTIASDQKATALWVENRGADPVTLQVRSLDWSQSAGEDRYDKQDVIVASPPIAQVAPGQRQLIRVIRRAPEPGAAEHSYRLLIDELPKPFDPAAKAERTAELAVQMRYSIPLFTYDGGAAADAAPALQARTVMIDGRRFAEISNHGAHHARLTDLRVVRGGQSVVVQSGLIGYVLPGAVMRWALPDGVPLGGSIVVGVNGGDQTLSPST